ncbi:universal stress protein [uncultured Acetobacteroides sp.]|uniref:universal stress protein n=1 Tax=uncultured Acetobacteroides sp. TaxID=1760811 RepID=UPI0029F5C31D|nr:universal stress protein [uncultured Acetobacteroides sp.]
MDAKKTYIVVLWDGSEQAENAFRHALRMDKRTAFAVLIMWMVRKRKFLESKAEFDAGVASEQEALRQVAERLNGQYGLLPEYVVKSGDVRSCIAEVLEEYSCSIIVSPEEYSFPKGVVVNVVKEFSSSSDIEVPLLVANNAPRHDNASIEVVVPLEYDPEFKDAVEGIVSLSRTYGCNFNFMKPILSDGQLKKELVSNIYFAKQVLDDNHIVYGIKSASKETDFIEEVYDFASSIEANYILSMSLNYGLYRKNPKYANAPFIWVNPHKRRYRSFN